MQSGSGVSLRADERLSLFPFGSLGGLVRAMLLLNVCVSQGKTYRSRFVSSRVNVQHAGLL